MTEYVAFALIGLGVGAFYAALATGLVVTYRGTGVINFAAGAMGSWGVYVADELRKTGVLVLPLIGLPDRIDLGSPLPTAPAVALGVGSAILIGLIAHVAVFRPLRAAPALAKVIATVGVMLISQALIVVNFGHEPRQVANLVSNDAIAVGGLNVPGDRLIIAAVAVVVTVGLWAYFRFTRLGLATLAGAENERAIASARFSPQLLAGLAWALASGSTALVLILASPFTVISPVVFTIAIVPALAAVMLARLSSLAVALAAGFGLGSINAMLTFASTEPWWPGWARVGITEAVQFVVLAVALFILGRALPERGAAVAAPLPAVHLPSNRIAVVAGLTAAAVVAVVATSGSYRFGVITSMIMAIIALSLVVLTGFVGQISLAQAAFAGTSGFALSKLLTATGLTFPVAPLVAALTATVLGVVVGVPALRIRGVHLAVVTLGLAVAVERFVFRNPVLSPGTGNPIGDPSLFGLDLGIREGRTIARLGFGLLVVVIMVVLFVGIGNLARASTGRRFLAVRSDESAAAAVGVDVSATKLVAFAISSFLAGVGGALLGYSRGQLSADSFTVFVGLSILTFAYLGGITSLSGAVVAGTFAPLGIGFVVLDRQLELGSWYLLASGIGLVLTAIFNPVGIAGANRAVVGQLRGRIGPVGRIGPLESSLAGQAEGPLGHVAGPTQRALVTLAPSSSALTVDVAPPPVGQGASTDAITLLDADDRLEPLAPVPAGGGRWNDPSEGGGGNRDEGRRDNGRSGGAGGVERRVWPGSEVVLAVEGIEVSFDGLRAVDGVDLEVRSGQIVGLIGANGAGKTTLLDAIGGFVEHRGTVSLGGRPLTGRAPHQRSAAGLARTWQSIQLFDDLSVADNLRVSAEPKTPWSALTELVRPNPRSRRPVEVRVRRTLDLMGLGATADRRPEELSLGRQKLVGLARAIVSRPAVVLLDEPAAGLDETARGRLADRLIDVVNDGASALVIDHDMTFVFGVCDHLYVLDTGRVIASGPPAEIRANRAVVAAYLGSAG